MELLIQKQLLEGDGTKVITIYFLFMIVYKLYRSVLVNSGCHNKISQAGWLKQQKFTVLKIRVLLGCLVRPLFWACRQLSYRCIAYNPSSVHTEEEKCLVSLPLLIRTWVKKSQTWQLNKNIISLTALSPTTVTEKVSISTYKLGTEDRIQTLTR